MRKNIVAGNWKMNFSVSETREFLNQLVPKVKNAKCEVVVCAPFTSLSVASEILKDSNIKLGAQNVYFEEKGAFTGEISPQMLKSVGVSYVIVGHSERRTYFKETNGDINKKVFACLKHDFIPILCVGETLEEREGSLTEKVLETQVKECLLNVSENDVKKIVIAYEPIWAIGTGKTATSEDADLTIKFIRKVVENIYNKEISNNITILYGGSVKPNIVKQQMSMENIDGVLVGGASIILEDFELIVNF